MRYGMGSLLQTELAYGITLRHAILGLIVLALLGGIAKVFGRHAGVGGNHLVKKRCPSCGWAGEVSQYAPKCPKCTKAIAS
jgi:hypothetical protein